MMMLRSVMFFMFHHWGRGFNVHWLDWLDMVHLFLMMNNWCRCDMLTVPEEGTDILWNEDS
jgi:hypothetical protein